jgi:hypothetical protein
VSAVRVMVATPPRPVRGKRARKTLCCGHRLFTADDRESTGTARLSPQMRDSQTHCLAVENERQSVHRQQFDRDHAEIEDPAWALCASPA